MKLHTTLISGAFVTAVAAEGTANSRLRHLKADSKSLKASSKAAKRGKSRYSSSYSSSYSMSYGPPPPPTPPVLPTPNPTRSTPPPTTRSPTAQPTGTCCNADALRQTILDKVYDSGDGSIFNSGPAKDAIAWLDGDACDCGQFCSEDQVVQRYILAVLYFSTNGNNWDSCSAPDNIQNDDTCQVQSSYGNNIISDDEGKTFSSGFKWLTCNKECEWGGINCNQNGLIIATDVEDNGLTGTLPNEVAALPRLFAFALEQNDISGTIPSTYSNLARLVILDLDFNSLEGSLLLDLSKMTKLRQLDLNNNNLEGTLGGLGWENTDLQFLDLSRNNFVGPIPTEIGDLPNLRSVQLYCNQLEAPLEWVNCPTADMVADDYICDDSSCECTEEYTQETCTAKLASNKSG